MKNILAVVVSFFLIGSLGSCAKEKKSENSIVLISFIDHPLFKTIENSFKNELKLLSKDKFTYRLIEGNAQGNIDNLPVMVSQFLTSNPEIIVPLSTPVSQVVLRMATDSQKIVYSFVSDTNNLGDALRQKNITGLSDVINYDANINLIEQIYGPNVKIGIIYNANEANSIKGINEIKVIATKKNLKVIYSSITNESELLTATKNILKNIDVILSIGDNTVGAGLKIVIDEAGKKNKAVFAIDEGSIKELNAAGGVSVDYEKLGKETAVVVSNIILQNTAPRSLPKILLQGDKLILNKHVLKSLGINIPKNISEKALFIE